MSHTNNNNNGPERGYNNSTGESIHRDPTELYKFEFNSNRRREQLRNNSVPNGQNIFNYPAFRKSKSSGLKVPNNRTNMNMLSKNHAKAITQLEKQEKKQMQERWERGEYGKHTELMLRGGPTNLSTHVNHSNNTVYKNVNFPGESHAGGARKKTRKNKKESRTKSKSRKLRKSRK
jgi:hypothetical protein